MKSIQNSTQDISKHKKFLLIYSLLALVGVVEIITTFLFGNINVGFFSLVTSSWIGVFIGLKNVMWFIFALNIIFCLFSLFLIGVVYEAVKLKRSR